MAFLGDPDFLKTLASNVPTVHVISADGMAKIRDELSELRAQLLTATKDRDDLHGMYVAKSQELEAVRKNHKATVGDMASVVDEHYQLRHKLEASEKQREVAIKIIESTSTECRQLRRKLEESEKARKDFQESLAALNSETEKALEELAEAKLKLDIFKSNSRRTFSRIQNEIGYSAHYIENCE